MEKSAALCGVIWCIEKEGILRKFEETEEEGVVLYKGLEVVSVFFYLFYFNAINTI